MSGAANPHLAAGVHPGWVGYQNPLRTENLKFTVKSTSKPVQENVFGLWAETHMIISSIVPFCLITRFFNTEKMSFCNLKK